MKTRLVMHPGMACPCGSSLDYGVCCLEPVAYVTRRIEQTLAESIPGWDRIDLPLHYLGLMVGLRPTPGEEPPTVEEIVGATGTLVAALMDYPEGVQNLDEGLRDLLRESGFRFPVESLSDGLIDGIIEDASEPDADDSSRSDLMAQCLEPYITEEFVEDIIWHLISRARRGGTGERVLGVVVWGLWNLHQDLPISENAVWDALFRLSLDQLWDEVLDEGTGRDTNVSVESAAEMGSRGEIVRLRQNAEPAVVALIEGDLNLIIPLFSVINGALKVRKLMSEPDNPGYDSLFDYRTWRIWGEHPITRHMRSPMKKDWSLFLGAFDSALERWIELEGDTSGDLVESGRSMLTLLECHGLPELDDLLAMIYTSCVRNILSSETDELGVAAILEGDYVKLLRYAQDLQEWGKLEAARHVRRTLLHRAEG